MNLSKLQEYFTVEVTPLELSDELHETIFQIIFLYGHTPDGTLDNSSFAEMIYRLHSLEDVLREVSKENQ